VCSADQQSTAPVSADPQEAASPEHVLQVPLLQYNGAGARAPGANTGRGGHLPSQVYWYYWYTSRLPGRSL